MDFDTIVIGAGVVGLAVARSVAQAGNSVLILDADEGYGRATSSRNSGVLHAGIYYPDNSLKARHCVAGNRMAYEFCAQNDVPHDKCGKLIVAVTQGQEADLELLYAQGMHNGVSGLSLLDGRQVSALEPAIEARAAILSPETGTVDQSAFMLALLGRAEASGAQLVTQTRVEQVIKQGEAIEVTCTTPEPFKVSCRHLINAAGHGALEIAHKLGHFTELQTKQFAKGNYFVLSSAKRIFDRHIYPMPNKYGLGCHVTIDVVGQVRFGPDVEWVDGMDYKVSADREPAFREAIRQYWPGVDEFQILPDYAGIRPKVFGADEEVVTDFIIGPDPQASDERIIHLLGVESPGFTSALSIANDVTSLVTETV